MNRFPLAPERRQPTLLQAINPVWWLSDDTQPVNGPHWTWAAWAERNILSNFTSTIIGVAAYNRTFYSPDTCTIWSPDGHRRWAWTNCGVFWLPLVSWKTATREKCIGWKPDGSFAINWRHRGAQEAKP